MRLSIRLRIGLTVLGTVVGLLALQMYVVLDRVWHAFLVEADDHLENQLAELRPRVGNPSLQTWIEGETRGETKWNESFYEVRDAAGTLVARSSNLPTVGLTASRSERSGGREFYDVPDARSRSGHRRIRVAEVVEGPYRVRLGTTLKREQKRYWALREQLFYALLLIASLGTGAAYLVATRALRPVRVLTRQARELQALASGELGRSGRGDEIDRLAAVLNDMLGRIRAEVAQVRRLTADAAHALRTPLTALRGNLELALGRSSGEVAETLESALEDVELLTRTVNQLLLLEKLDSTGGAALDPKRFDAGSMVADLLGHVRVVAEERGIQLAAAVEAAPVEADTAQLRQAVLNVVDNALRHTPDGGRVSVAVRSRGERVEIEVEDTGPGIATGDLERVFERFYSRPGTRSDHMTGTGLGLPIARAVARACGGNLRASSPGGARFVFDLPRAAS